MTVVLSVFFPWVSTAQRTTQNEVRTRVMERLNEEEAAQLLASFRMQALEENFCFQFQLEHKPRRGRTVRYKGIMYGSRNEKGPISRLKLYPDKISEESSGSLSPVEMIVQNGPVPKVWIRRQSTEAFTLIKDGSMFEPIFEGVLYSPFDLQMPFIFWDDHTYEGPSRVLSRIGHKFLMFPPEDSLAEREGINAVRVSVDDTYYALLRAEVLQDDKKVRSRFTVRGIKKIQGLYIVKQVELKNLITKDATDFKVKAACLGLQYTAAMFDPEKPEEPPETSTIPFEIL